MSAVSNITAAIELLQKISSDQKISIEQAGGTIREWEKVRTTEQMTSAEKREAYNVYAPKIAEIAREYYAVNPEGDLADLDATEIGIRLGCPDKQGWRSFIRHQIKTLRLTYQANGANDYHAAAGVAAE